MMELSQDKLDAISVFMNFSIREQVHFALAPCTPAEFLQEYVNRDKSILPLLHSEFDIEVTSDGKIYQRV